MTARPDIERRPHGWYHVAVDFDDGTRKGYIIPFPTLEEAEAAAQRLIDKKEKKQNDRKEQNDGTVSV